ncbi:MAG: lipocalin-like domain-containing protein [Chthoniobacterales bacterium]
MKRLLLVTALAISCVAANWQTAEPGWQYEFPRDHHIHPEFKTEWWYFTGNLEADGKHFGYQLTFFRQGIRPPSERVEGRSRFVVDDLKFAHFTVTDVMGKRFVFQQKTSRGAYGEAGFDRAEGLAWIESWNLALDGSGAFHLRAESSEAALDLQLESAKPPVIHGAEGISQKAAGAGHASHYYSLTRLATTGELRIGEKTFAVKGASWFDHEWATNQLAPGEIGWDWLSLQLNDGTELMLYQMRLENCAADPSSSGTLVAADGTSVHLASGDFRMSATEYWKSDETTARYPIGWRIEIPAHQLVFEVRAELANQELALLPQAYWEGAVEVIGTRKAAPIKGRGYLELTGYAGPLRELQR